MENDLLFIPSLYTLRLDGCFFFQGIYSVPEELQNEADYVFENYL
jgi:hypothetical protein